MGKELHNVLRRQIKKTIGESSPMTPELQQLLERISETYHQFDEDHRLIERSLELTSQEMMEINKGIEATVVRRTEELQQEHARFLASIQSLGIGFIMCAADGRVLLANKAMHALVEQVGHDDPSGAHPTAVAESAILQHLNKCLEHTPSIIALHQMVVEKKQSVEIPEISCSQKIIRIAITPISDQQKPADHAALGSVILVEDITERKIIERSKDEFFSIASHELRTPLTAIRGNTEIIEKYFAQHLEDKELAEMIYDIHHSSVRLIEIVNDFLDISGIEQGKVSFNPEPFALHEVAGEVASELSGLLKQKSLSLLIDDSVGKTPLVYADKSRIKQVIYNLIGNALKFTEHGAITVTAEADEHMVKVTVIDHGRGISEENQTLLFRKFQQAGSSLLTRDTSKGTGLGLYISRLIIERSGGTIQLEYSKVDEGSAFSFTLPRDTGV